jgi:hypothetical protein
MEITPASVQVPKIDEKTLMWQAQSTISPMESDVWDDLLRVVKKRVAERRAAFHEPVRVVDDDIRVSEYAMVPEQPYLVRHKDGMFEFIRKLDGFIEVSEVHYNTES